MTRKKARDTAFKLIYQVEMQKETPEHIFETFYMENELHEKISGYVEDVVFGVFKNKKSIDAIITKLLEGWRLERVSKISLSAIRLSLYEMSYRGDIPESVSINEAVSLAKEYESTEAASFVNGVLASFIKAKEAKR